MIDYIITLERNRILKFRNPKSTWNFVLSNFQMSSQNNVPSFYKFSVLFRLGAIFSARQKFSNLLHKLPKVCLIIKRVLYALFERKSVFNFDLTRYDQANF